MGIIEMHYNCAMKTTKDILSSTLQLAPGVHIYLRNKDQIQVGLDPQNSLCLPAALHGLLKKCDGYTSVAKLIDLFNVEQDSILQILNLLVNRKLLICVNHGTTQLTSNQQSHHLDASRSVNSIAHLVNQRSKIRLVIVGGGRLGSTLALLLGNSGFSNLRVLDSTKVTLNDLTPWGFSRLDVNLRRDFVIQTMLERVHRDQLKSMRTKETRSKPDLFVFAPDPVSDLPYLDPKLADVAVESDTPFIALATSPASALITSVINPGSAGCIRCYHLHQSDRDDAWPRLVTQLIGKQVPDQTPTSLILRTALHGYEQISRWLENELTQDNHWQNLTNSGEISNFDVPAHADCGCTWLAKSNAAS